MPGGGDPRLEQTHDARMSKRHQNLTLPLEAGHRRGATIEPRQDLDGHLPLDRHALASQEDLSESPLPDRLEKFERPDVLANPRTLVEARHQQARHERHALRRARSEGLERSGGQAIAIACDSRHVSSPACHQ